MSKARNLANLLSEGSALADGTVAATEVTGLHTVATSGSFNDLSNQPTPFDPSTLGTASAQATGAFATAAQGTKANTALQPALAGVTSVDATTAAAFGAAGVGGLTTLVAENAAFGTGNLVKIPLGNYKTQTFYFNNIHASAATSLVGRTTDSNDNVITANNTYFNTTQSGSSGPNNRAGYPTFHLATSGGNIDTHLTVRVVDAYSSTLQTMMYIHYGQTEAQNRTGYPDFYLNSQTFTRMRYVERNQSLVFTFSTAVPTFNSGITYTSYGVS